MTPQQGTFSSDMNPMSAAELERQENEKAAQAAQAAADAAREERSKQEVRA